jgi:hypothetical protein
VVFDQNAPIPTPRWLNTLDNDPPTSHVLPLSATQSSSTFTVRWAGTDVGSSIRDYSIFVSRDDGPFTAFLTNTPDTSAGFAGQSGSTYAFYSIARDQTGNRESKGQVAEATTQVSGDQTAPATAATPTPSPNGYGWNSTSVNVSLSAEDNPGGSGVKQISYTLSGAQSASAVVAGSTAAVTISAEGSTTVSYYATDNAGNRETAKTVTVWIDETLPMATFGLATPAPNGAGWNKTDVSIPFTASDTPSGVDSTNPASPLVLSAEGTAVTGTVTVTDKAGNTATFTSPAVKIDKTAPTLTFGAPSPPPNSAGWNNTNVSTPFTTADNLSGVASASPGSSLVLTAEGTAVTGSVMVTDVAGNTATFTSGAVKIDKTPPGVTCSVTPNVLWPPNHQLVTVTASVTVTDALSGPAGFTLTSVASNEPDMGLGSGDIPNDIQGFEVGTASTTGQFRAERAGTGTGRVYTLIYTGHDVAGNRATCSTAVSVPLDYGH